MTDTVDDSDELEVHTYIAMTSQLDMNVREKPNS